MAGEEGYSQTWGSGTFDPREALETDYGPESSVRDVERLEDDLYRVETDEGDAFIHYRGEEVTLFGDRISVVRTRGEFWQELGVYCGFTDGIEESYEIGREDIEQETIDILDDFGITTCRLAADGRGPDTMEDVDHSGTAGVQGSFERGTGYEVEPATGIRKDF